MNGVRAACGLKAFEMKMKKERNYPCTAMYIPMTCKTKPWGMVSIPLMKCLNKMYNLSKIQECKTNASLSFSL